MAQPAISVVIPAYNRAALIGRAIGSVLGQSRLPLEVVVADDGSTDDTVAVAKRFDNPAVPVRCLLADGNAGAQAARNRGIRAAQGEWVAFLDSDDEWAPDKLEKQIVALGTVDFDPLTVVHTDAWRRDPDHDTPKVWRLPPIDGENVYAQLLAAQGPLFPALMTSKQALERIGCLDEDLASYQEWDTAIRLAKECRFIHLREPLFTYHAHAGETISKNPLKGIKGYQYIVDKFREEIIHHCGSSVLNAHLTDNAIYAMECGCFCEAGEILGKCIGNSGRIMMLKLLAKLGIRPGPCLRVDRALKTIIRPV